MVRAFPLLAAALLAWGAGDYASRGLSTAPLPPPGEMRIPESGAAGDLIGMALGTRRLMADLWFIRLMQYYGTQEVLADQRPGYDAEGAYLGKGRYPEFSAMARHVLEMDPGFASAGLYAAGALAFNMDRPEEAEQLLDFGLKYRPHEWKYPLLLTAIGYSKAKDPAAVAAAIAPLVKDPDCPVMLKQLAAFLNKKAGHFAAAAVIYSDIAATSKDQAYVANARRELVKLSTGTYSYEHP
jgi:tetratricopeptide (TPR) repeat protein